MLQVQITYGIIVLNGEPFTRYTLRAIYPYAHQIIVVEGACPAARGVATQDGHSLDETLTTLRRFQAEEDPAHKLIIVTAEDEGHLDGFWPGEKDEMSQAYAKRATGNYLWQVDVDEFYHEDDMPIILACLLEGIDAISFPTLSFWGGIAYIDDGEYMRTQNAREFHRLFAWRACYRYTTHRPPTVIDDIGVNLREKHWYPARTMERRGIYMYHYSMLLPKQVREKCAYYSRVDWATFNAMEAWADEVFFALKRPYAVCNVLGKPLSWLMRYHGKHPAQIYAMVEAIKGGEHPDISFRPTDDIEGLLSSSRYRFGRTLRILLVLLLPLKNSLVRFAVSILKKTPIYPLYRSWRSHKTRVKRG